MDFTEITVKDGTVYKIKNAVSVGIALEYIKRFLTDDKDENIISILPKIEDGKEPTEGQLFAFLFRKTALNMVDVEFLIENTLIDVPPVVPIDHAYQLLEPMKTALHLHTLLSVIASKTPENNDPDFPDDPEKN